MIFDDQFFLIQETESVEGISFERKERDLAADAHTSNGAIFSKMCNLRLLKIKNIETSRDIERLSNELRLFEWHNFPLECMPQNFKPKNLVELSLPNSHIQQLWSEKVKLYNFSSTHYPVSSLLISASSKNNYSFPFCSSPSTSPFFLFRFLWIS